jgi:hypothetical protein
MQMLRVCSSNLVAVGYDDLSNTLYIQFKNGTYKYFNVPYHVYKNLMQAPSKGQYHSVNIQDKYHYARL